MLSPGWVFLCACHCAFTSWNQGSDSTCRLLSSFLGSLLFSALHFLQLVANSDGRHCEEHLIVTGLRCRLIIACLGIHLRVWRRVTCDIRRPSEIHSSVTALYYPCAAQSAALAEGEKQA